MAFAFKSLFVAVVCSIAAAPTPAQSTLIGVTYNGYTLSINSATGSGTVLKQTNVNGLNAMAIDPQGRLLTANLPVPPGPNPTVWYVEPILGGITSAFFPYLNSVSGLALSPAGVLYAIDNGPSGNISSLWVFDMGHLNGSAQQVRQIVGPVTLGNFSTTLVALAFAPDGTLYGWDVGWGLLTIDPANGHAIDVNGALEGSSPIQALACAPDGTLYGARDNLYTVDRISGAITLVGGPIAGGDVRGMEFLPDVPHIYCTAKANPLNCVPHISFQGTPSVSAGSGFVLSASSFINQHVGGFGFSIYSAASIPWGSGYLCESYPIRSPQMFTGGNALPAVDCSGVLAFDFNTFVANVAPSGVFAGRTIYGQFLCRDPLDPVRIDMSNAIAFTMRP